MDELTETQAVVISPAEVRLAAMNLLARREHSLLELKKKLGKRFADEQVLLLELQRLANENLQSDLRFAESFVRLRAEQGKGPLRLTQEMRERGISDMDIEATMAAADIDWCAVAVEVFRKKFGESGAADLKEKAKRIRFMQYRGFSGDHYRRLIDA